MFMPHCFESVAKVSEVCKKTTNVLQLCIVQKTTENDASAPDLNPKREKLNR